MVVLLLRKSGKQSIWIGDNHNYRFIIAWQSSLDNENLIQHSGKHSFEFGKLKSCHLVPILKSELRCSKNFLEMFLFETNEED